MKKKSKFKISENAAVVLIVIAILAVSYGISWIITCGVIKLITICFGLTFDWTLATGIWLVLCLLKGIFSVTVKSK